MDLAHPISLLTMPRLDDLEKMALDLMDAHLQLLLAITWQNSQNDDLSRLLALRKTVEQKLDAQAQIFPSESERKGAVMQILELLQQACRRPPRAVDLAYANWTTFPAASDLAHLGPNHRDALVPVTQRLIRTTRVTMESRAAPDQQKQLLENTIRSCAKDLDFPLYLPAMVNLVLHFARRPKPVGDKEVRNALTQYWMLVLDRLKDDFKHGARDKIVSELLCEAREIRLQIDQCYPWDTLAMMGTKSSLDALQTYTIFNVHEWIKDSHFSPGRVSAKTLSPAQFQQLFTPTFVRNSTIMMTGDDRQTRQFRRSILDTVRGEVQINDRRVSNSLLMLVPYDQDSVDLERLMALFVLKLERKRRERQPGRSNTFLDIEHLPPFLQQLITKHGIRRKICETKKNLLFCLGGLLAENIYMYRDHHKTLLDNGMPIRFRKDADKYAASLLSKHGFQYTAESLRRGRAQFRRDFLERVPAIFGLEDT